MSDDIAIRAEGLTKIYKLYNSPVDRLKESLHPFRKQYHHDFYALNDIYFDIRKGESVGIIGKNGSGKSTLLKILTGVLTPTSGKVTVNGKVSALLELGVGFNPELSGIENVYFNGMLMGYTREEVDSRLDDILSFADIGEFVKQPVKTYSSGMFVRLAFAVAVRVEPEILIVDEALSVGDVFFQQKCYAKIREIIDKGTTCLFVSHDTQAVRNICQSCILLANGLVSFSGGPEEAISRYLVFMHKTAGEVTNKPVDLETSTSSGESLDHFDAIASHSILAAKGQSRHGEGGVEIVAVRVINENGLDSLTVPVLHPVDIQIMLRSRIYVSGLTTGIHLYDRIGNLVFASGASQLGVELPDLTPDAILIVRFRLTMNVQPGDYTFSIGVAEISDEQLNKVVLRDRCENLGPLTVTSDSFQTLPFYGIAQLPLSVSFS